MGARAAESACVSFYLFVVGKMESGKTKNSG